MKLVLRYVVDWPVIAVDDPNVKLDQFRVDAHDAIRIQLFRWGWRRRWLQTGWRWRLTQRWRNAIGS